MADAPAEGEERLIAAAQKIVNSLQVPMKDDMILILSNFDDRLSGIADFLSADRRLDEVESVILGWDSNPADTSDLCKLLSSVNRLIQLKDKLDGPGDAETLDRAETVLQQAMLLLEDELRRILTHRPAPLDASKLYESLPKTHPSINSNDEDSGDVPNSDGGEREASEDLGSLSSDSHVELIDIGVVHLVEQTADLMIRSGYEKECCQVYIGGRREALDEYLAVLGIDKLSIEDIQRMDWDVLDGKITNWILAVKVVVRVLLIGEKSLCEQILEKSESAVETCYTEITRSFMVPLLNFGEAIAIIPPSPEKLFRLLDMYDTIHDVLPRLRALISENSSSYLYEEATGVLTALGNAAQGTLMEFKNAIQRESTRRPTPGGDIHPLSRYVMNYMKFLLDYGNVLNVLLDESLYPECDTDNSEERNSTTSLLGRCLSHLISTLETNIDKISKLYEDHSIRYIFLLNNIHYIVEKVKGCELRVLLGDNWVRSRRVQLHQCSTNYLRTSWTKVLSYLRDDGAGGSGSGSSKTASLKEKFKNFNLAFEEIYRNQTTWKVSDSQLREELRISISGNVIPAYRTFMGRIKNHLHSGRSFEKYMKYNADDIQSYLMDLFEGSSKSINISRRKRNS